MASSDRYLTPYQMAFTAAGAIGVGYYLRFYVGGGGYSTPKDVFSDSALTTTIANAALVADAAGRFPTIYLGSSDYGVKLFTNADVLVWSADPVAKAATSAATTTTAGIIELSTLAESLLGTSTSLVPPVANVTEMIQSGFFSYGGTAGGTANALTGTPAPLPTALAAGMKAIIKAASTNTGATTLNWATLGVVAVKVGGSTSGGTACNGGEIIAGMTYEFTYSTADSCWFVDTKGWTPATVRALTEDTSPAVGDWLLTYDISAALPKKVSITTLGATQAQLEAETALTAFTTPGRQHFHPNHPKFHVKWADAAGTPTIGVSNNVSSLGDTATGTVTINFTTAFSTANYVPFGIAQRNATNDDCDVSIRQSTNPLTTALVVVTNASATNLDSTYAAVSGVGDFV